MKNFKLVFIALISLVMVSSSCKKDEDENVTPQSEDLKTGDIILSRATDYGNDWIYYSFAEGKEVDSTNHANTLTWDIAFNRNNVRTNSGLSGIGEGGVYDAGKVDFASVIEANETGYIADETIQIAESVIPGQAPIYMSSPGSSVFVDCIEIGFGNSGPVYNPNDHIFVLKTANGKFAKVWIKGYSSEGGASGFINMKYAYQAGDGRKFE